MKFKFAALPLMVFAASAAAESYQSISNAAYIGTEIGNVDADTFAFGSTYYFAPKETLGPLKEFEYINKVTNIFGGYSYTDTDFGDADALTVGAEYFDASGFMGGVSVTEGDFNDGYDLSVGYLFNPDLLVQLRREKIEDVDAEWFVDASYNYQLNGSDYIGFNFVADDDFDSRTLSSKLFKYLGGENWLTVDASYTSNDEFDNDWEIGAEYYFSKTTSVGVGYEDDETFDLGVSHFFTPNVAGQLAYQTNSDIDLDQFLLGVTIQL